MKEHFLAKLGIKPHISEALHNITADIWFQIVSKWSKAQQSIGHFVP
jgi:hypothetical protein